MTETIAWQRAEGPLFWVTFTVTFLAVALWESRRPRLALRAPTGHRWGVHGVLMLAAGLSRMLILRTTPVAVALAAGGRGPAGNLPLWLAVPLTLLALDFTKYVVHRLYHAVPWLWRIHRVHHSDPDFDITTGSRFHPLEAVIGQAADLAVIALLAPPVACVVIAMLTATIINNVQHANADFAPAWERMLRRFLVTPALHRIHHSAEPTDEQSNFGELVPWWDRLLGTFRAAPRWGEEGLSVGLAGFDGPRSIALGQLIVQPLRSDAELAGHTEAQPAGSIR